MTDFAKLVMGADTSGLKVALRDLANLSKQSEKTEGKTNALNGALKKMATQAAVALGGVALLRDVGKFQTAMAEVSTLVDTAVFDMGRMQKAVLSASGAFGGAATQQAKASYQIISAGASTAADATNLLTASNKLAVGGVTEVAIAADGLTSALNAYGLSSDKATEISDAMFVAMRAGKTTIGELSAELGKVAPFAAQAGISFDELMASVAALTKGGVQTNVAMTGLRAILAAVTKPSQEALDMAKQLGIQFNATALEAQGLGDFLANVAEKTGGATDKISMLFGGVEALVPVLAFAGQAGKDLAKIMEYMNAKAGATEAAFDKMSKTVEFQLGRVLVGLRNQFLELATPIGNTLVPVFTLLADNLDHVVIAATSLAVLMAGKLAISLAAAGVAALAPTVRMLALAASISASSLAATVASVAFKALSRVLLTTAIGTLVIVAGHLVALLMDLKTATGSWGQAFALVGGVIKGVFADIGNWFGNLLAGNFDKLKFSTDNATDAVAKLKKALEGTGEPITVGNFSLAEVNAALAGSGKGGAVTPTVPQETLDKFKELTTSLQQQTEVLGMTERATAIYNATIQLGEGATAAMKERVAELAAALFDKNAAVVATKATTDSYKTTLDGINESIGAQLDALIKTDEEIAVSNALKKVTGVLDAKELKVLTEKVKLDLAMSKAAEKSNKLDKAAIDLKRELMTNQELLNEKVSEYLELLESGEITGDEFIKAVDRAKSALNIDTRSIGQQMWDGLKATFFDPFEAGAEKMADEFADKVNKMSDALKGMSKSESSTLDKIQSGLNALAYVSGIGPYAAAASAAISVGKAIVGIVKSLKTALFGGKWQTTGGGLQLQLGAQGVLGQSFETQHKKGGLFSSSKDRTVFSGISAEQQAQFNTAYNAVLDNATTAFGLFGIEASRDIMEQVRIAALNIKTTGEGALSEADAQKAVENWFKQLDTAVVNAVGGESVQALLDLATEGEAASETLIRLGNQLSMVNSLLNAVDVAMYEIGISSAVMANSLVEFAGGMDSFQAGINSFFENFFTEQEQFDKLTQNLTTTFSALGMTLPETRSGVRALVDGLDLTTEAGQRAFAAIVTSSEALNAYFTTLETNAENAAQAAADAAQAAADALTETTRKRTDIALAMLTRSIDTEKEIRRMAYNESVALIKEESRIRTEAANLALGAARQNLNALQNEVGSIMSALSGAQSQFDPSGSQRSAVAFIKAALQSGNLAGTGAAAQNAVRLEASNFATAAAFRREQVRTLNLLGELSEAGQDQINYAELTVRAIEDEIVAIQASTAELIDVETLLFEQQIEVLDNQLINAENQLNVLRGIDAGILSVENALRDFYTSINAERGNGAVPPGVVSGGASVASAQITTDKMIATLEEIKNYSQATATSTTKAYNLEDRVWRETQSEEMV